MDAVDVHAHWYPKRFLEVLARDGPAHGLEWKETEKGPQFRIRNLITGPAGPRFVDLDARLQAMDEQGVAVHALSLTQPMVMDNPRLAPAAKQAIVAGNARRLLAIRTLNPHGGHPA
jgi:aminocarboxymuconate-semialdehyde decarboxylase